MNHLRARSQVEHVQTLILRRVRVHVRLAVHEDVLRRLLELREVDPDRLRARFAHHPGLGQPQETHPPILHHVENLVLLARQPQRGRARERVVEDVLDLYERLDRASDLRDRLPAVDVVRRRRKQRSHRRVGEIKLREAVPDVDLDVVVSNRQPLLHLAPFLRGRVRFVINPVRDRIYEPTARAVEHGRVVDLDDDHFVRGVPGVNERLGLVVVVRKPVENPPSGHAVLLLDPVLHERHHEIIRHDPGAVEVPLRLLTELGRVVVRSLAKQVTGVDERHVERLGELARGGGFAARRGADDRRAEGLASVLSDARVPPRTAEAPYRVHGHHGRHLGRDRFFESRVPRRVRFVRQDVAKHRLGFPSADAFGDLDDAAGGRELRDRFFDAFLQSLRVRLPRLRGDVLSVRRGVVLRVREEDEYRVEAGGAHRRRARGVRLHDRHLPFQTDAFELARGGAVHHRDRRVADVFARPLAVADDDFRALDEFPGVDVRVKRLARDEGVVHAVNLPILGLARRAREREPKLIRELLQELFEHDRFVRPGRARDDQGLRRRGDDRRVRPPDRGLQVPVREVNLVVDDDVREQVRVVVVREDLHVNRRGVEFLDDFRGIFRFRGLAVGVFALRGRRRFRRRRRLLPFRERRVQKPAAVLLHVRRRDVAVRAVGVLSLQPARGVDGDVAQHGDLLVVRRRLHGGERRSEELAVLLGRLRERARDDLRFERRAVDKVKAHAVLFPFRGRARRVSNHVHELTLVLFEELIPQRLFPDVFGAADDHRLRRLLSLARIPRRDDVRAHETDDILERLQGFALVVVRELDVEETVREPAVPRLRGGFHHLLDALVRLSQPRAEPFLVRLDRRGAEVQRHDVPFPRFLERVRRRGGG